MVVARAAVRAAMLTGLGMTGLALAGEAPLPVRAREASRATGTVGGAGQAPEVARGDGAGGGRDPFVRPAPPGSRPAEARPAGLSGLAVDEAVLRGVVSIREGRLGVLEGPDARAWVVRPGDRLYDGRVQGVTAHGVVLLRDAAGSAPLAERVVRMGLRDTGSAR